MPDDEAAELALWRRARDCGNAPRRGDRVPPLDALTVAAWLDGRLGDDEADAVDARLAADPAALDEMIDARGALRSPAAARPGVVARAAALVAPARPRRTRAVWRVAAAAALIAAALSGYLVGATAHQPRAAHTGDVDELLQALDTPDDAVLEDDA